jgi:hypothetical protein
MTLSLGWQIQQKEKKKIKTSGSTFFKKINLCLALQH